MAAFIETQTDLLDMFEMMNCGGDESSTKKADASSKDVNQNRYDNTRAINHLAIAFGRSQVADFYSNKSVLITGGSGFVGKVLVEKLLRSCSQIKRVFLLIRPKRQKKPHERLSELLNLPLFDVVRQRNFKLEEKVQLVEGDVTLRHFGLSERDLSIIKGEVSIVFHSAATIKFDGPLKRAVEVNLSGVKNLIDVCRMLPRLQALVHISTAYANCDKREVDEHVYPVGQLEPEKLIQLANLYDENTLQELKPNLLSGRPNTYTYTKAMAEWLLVRSARDLPVVICRPSIVIASHLEPFSGWIDNYNGPTGILLGVGKGLMRTMLAQKTYVADIVPVDLVGNLIITLGWFAHVHQNILKSNLRASKNRIELLACPNPDVVSSDCNGICGEKSNESSQLLSIHDASATSRAKCELPDSRVPSAPPSLAIGVSDEVVLVGRPSSSSYSIGTDANFVADQLESFSDAYLEDGLKQLYLDVRHKLESRKLPPEWAEIPVFHCVSGAENPITWGEIRENTKQALYLYPSSSLYRHHGPADFTNSKLSDFFFHWTTHLIPAHVVDFFARLLGHKPILVDIYRKYEQATKVLQDFTMREWKFSSENRLVLYKKLISSNDRRLFNCDLTSIDWADFFRNYALGVRRYILNEKDDTIEQAKFNLRYVYLRNSALQILFVALIVYLFLL